MTTEAVYIDGPYDCERRPLPHDAAHPPPELKIPALGAGEPVHGPGWTLATYVYAGRSREGTLLYCFRPDEAG